MRLCQVFLRSILRQNDGTTSDITLQVVLFIPKLMVNLLSLTKAIKNTGVALSSKCQIISLNVGTTEIYFDKAFKHESWCLLGIEIYPTANHIAATAQTLDINALHERFGHRNSQVLAATDAKYGFQSKNDLDICSNCASKLRIHWEGELILKFPVSRTQIMEELIIGF
jgi:hypothetical protein